MILDNVRDGNAAVTLAEDVPAHTLVGGVPARVIKTVEQAGEPVTLPVYTELDG